MPDSDVHDFSRLLADVDEGRAGAMDRLMEAVYADLHRVAERHMAARFGQGLAGVTLEPAALVNESFMKLIRQRKGYDNREQFFAIATRVMIRVLLDYQRQRLAAKRGAGAERVTLSLVGQVPPGTTLGAGERIRIEALVGALDRLDELDPRKADVVSLRVIWGLEMKEIARTLDISLATVERDWSFAKAWLAREAGNRPGAERRSDGATKGEAGHAELHE